MNHVCVSHTLLVIKALLSVDSYSLMDLSFLELEWKCWAHCRRLFIDHVRTRANLSVMSCCFFHLPHAWGSSKQWWIQSTWYTTAWWVASSIGEVLSHSPLPFLSRARTDLALRESTWNFTFTSFGKRSYPDLILFMMVKHGRTVP